MQIPEGWEEKSISQICNLKKGVQFNKLDLDKEGLYPCINGGVEPSGFSSKWNTEKNTITISEGGNSCGYVNYLEKPFWLGGHCYALLELRNDIVKEFLYQSLKGVQDDIMDLRIGSGLPNIQQKAIRVFEIKIPKSTIEQKKIAEILSKVDTAIEQTQSLIAKYQRIKTGLMQDLLTKGIDKNGNIRSEETHEFKDSELGRIPVEWEVAELYKITKEDICYGIVQVGKHINNGIPTIAIKDLNTNYQNVHLTSLKIEGTYKRSRVIDGDLLISIKATTDKIDIVPKTFIGNISRDIAKIRLNEECNSDFYKNYFFSPFGKQTLSLITVGSTRKEISIAPLKKLKVIKPPLNEQEKIVLSFIELDSKTRYDHLNLNKLQSIKTALMQDLLSGKKRVTSIINGEL